FAERSGESRVRWQRGIGPRNGDVGLRLPTTSGCRARSSTQASAINLTPPERKVRRPRTAWPSRTGFGNAQNAGATTTTSRRTAGSGSCRSVGMTGSSVPALCAPIRTKGREGDGARIHQLATSCLSVGSDDAELISGRVLEYSCGPVTGLRARQEGRAGSFHLGDERLRRSDK